MKNHLTHLKGNKISNGIKLILEEFDVRGAKRLFYLMFGILSHCKY